MNRIYRRVVIRHFGSSRNFILWLLAVVGTIYLIDTYVLTHDRLQSLVPGKKPVEHMSENLATKENQRDINQNANQPAQELPDKVPPKEALENAPAKEKSAVKDQDPPAAPPGGEKQPEAPAPPAAAGGACGVTEVCPPGKYPYAVRTGEGRETAPTVCFNGVVAISPEKGNGGRGINMAVFNDKTLALEEVRNFDVYQEDAVLLRYLKLGVQDHHIILAASQDEASFNLKGESKMWMNRYGSSVIDKLKFRDGFIIIGQRGLAHGSAVEKHQSRGSNEFAEPTEMKGCLPVPLGKLEELPVEKAEVEANPNLKVGEELPNCGVGQACGSNSFAVHLYTGKENKEGPKICVNGKYVLAKGLNDGGRGFNVAIIDPKTKDVVRVGHFDTYAEDSSNLEIFIEMMNDNEILLAVSHDDASKNLNVHATKIFESLGSTMLSKMSFRDVWAFVGQKGLTGHSTIEEIEFAGTGSAWPRPIDRKLCVPTELKGSQIKPDPLANKNEKRRKFCAKFDGYGDFCETEHIDESLTPAPLTDKALENHSIFLVPIIVIPGLNHNAVRMQLETLIMNPGISPQMVTVMYDEKFDEPAALAELFNFKTAKMVGSTKYVYQVEKALEKVWELFPEAKHVLVLEEEVILGPDFLYFMSQCLTAADSDDSIIGVSAFNENGYKGFSTNPGLAYRVDTFPGLGFLLKKAFYDEHMKGHMNECCLKRSWESWFGRKLGGKEMIVPDVSRVYRRPYEGLSEMADFLKELFNRDRVTNLEARPKLTNADNLTKYKYEEELSELLRASAALDTANVADCLQGRGLGFYIPETAGKSLSVYYEQQAASDFTVLSALTRCFKLFHVEGYRPRGLHNGLLRFTYKGNTVLLVGSESPYAKFMPKSYKMVQRSQLPPAGS